MASAKSAPRVNSPGGGGGVGVGGGVTLASHTWVPRLDLITEKQNNAVQIDLLAAYLGQTTSINCWTLLAACADVPSGNQGEALPFGQLGDSVWEVKSDRDVAVF